MPSLHTSTRGRVGKFRERKATRVRIAEGFGTVGWSLLVWVLMVGAMQGEDVPRYNRDIRPILSDNCFFCHGPDKNQRQAGMRLDIREAALEQEVFVPGDPDASELIRRIYHEDKDERMPPADSHKRLTAEQKDLMRRWVAAGAPYEPHWSHIPVERPLVPEVEGRGASLQAVDAFVLSRLRQQGLEPVGQADRATLLRRLSFDLIGLPPTPEEVAGFVHDEDPRAYAGQVERLLQSPHFGERMAVPWLDVVRYADTVGYHGDQQQNIFPYRDYVIDAFNGNKPFDVFTREQLAGDLMSEPTEEQMIATGFNRLNMMTREGGAQAKEYLAKYQADRVRTVSTAWLGSTMACAECHDHKFDPFTMKDFYAMEAFFADLKQWGVYGYYNYAPVPELKGFNNDSPFPPEMEVESEYLSRRRQRLADQAAVLLEARNRSLETDEDVRNDYGAWREAAARELALYAEGWRPLSVMDVDSDQGTEAEVLGDGSILFRGKPRRNEEHRVETLPLPGRLASLRVEVLPDEAHDSRVARGGQDSFDLQVRLFLLRQGEDKERSLPWHHGEANLKEATYHRGLPEAGIEDTWKSDPEHVGDRHVGRYLLREPVDLKAGDRLVIKLRSESAGRVRLGLGSLAWPASGGAPDLAALREAFTQENQDEDQDQNKEAAQARVGAEDLVRRTYWLSRSGGGEFLREYHRVQSEILACREGKTFTMVSVALEEPMTTRVLPRGNWMDDSGEVVDPAPPGFLAPRWDRAESSRMTRLDLADWLVDRQNPLTARNFVNRLWQQFFGMGLSRTVEELGAQGEWPTHPELLDWLAAEFMESGWDIKHMVRLLVLSETYRRSSQPTSELISADPNNRWYGRMRARRLPAELVRDNALAVSGLLNRDVGGPSVRPYQPAGYYEHLNFPRREYEAHEDGRQYRRGVYMHWQRTFLHPMLANFDAQSREECVPERTLSNSPQQALTLLNDPTFVEAARAFGQRLVLHEGMTGFSDRLDWAYRLTLARSPSEEESNSLRDFYQAQRAHWEGEQESAETLLGIGLWHRAAEVDAAELAAWTAVCRVLLNLHETITRY